MAVYHSAALALLERQEDGVELWRFPFDAELAELLALGLVTISAEATPRIRLTEKGRATARNGSQE